MHITGTQQELVCSGKISSLSPSDSVSDVWPRRWKMMVSVDDKRSGVRHVFLVHLTLKATWVSAPEAGYAADCVE